MMTPHQRVRAVVDRMNKAKALRPAIPTGGENRTMMEAVNTGANARGLAELNVRQAKPNALVSLAEMIRKARMK